MCLLHHMLFYLILILAFKAGVIAPIFLIGKPSLNSYTIAIVDIVSCSFIIIFLLLLCLLNMLLTKEVENTEHTLSQSSLLLEHKHITQSSQWVLRESLLGFWESFLPD